jgi:hypothetical protein
MSMEKLNQSPNSMPNQASNHDVPLASDVSAASRQDCDVNAENSTEFSVEQRTAQQRDTQQRDILSFSATLIPPEASTAESHPSVPATDVDEPSAASRRWVMFWLALGPALLALFAWLIIPKAPSNTLRHQGYIWQLQWQNEHEQLLSESQQEVQELKVLALQWQLTDTQAVLRQARVDSAALAKDQRPVWLVVRIDGDLSRLAVPEVVTQLTSLLLQWRQQGVKVVGIEIDHDAPTRLLLAYRDFFVTLKQSVSAAVSANTALAALLPAGQIEWSITALPAWLTSADFIALSQVAPWLTLQVHAVSHVDKGLFNPTDAALWVEQLAARRQAPFTVALPAYQSAQVVGQDGALIAIESEVSLPLQGERREMAIDPLPVQQLLARWQQQPVANMVAISWFRLPLSSDVRSWPYVTLAAVIQQQPLLPKLSVQIETDPQGAQHIYLHNAGNSPAQLPTQLLFAGEQCLASEPRAPYQAVLMADTSGATPVIESQAWRWQLNLHQQSPWAPRIAPQQRRLIGWWRCKTITLAAPAELNTAVNAG